MAFEQLSDVVQRCQTVQSDDYTTEDYDVFMIAGRTCIEEGDCAQVLSIVVDDKNQAIVRCMGWNLLPPLIHVLLKKEDKNLPQCLAIFKHLLKVCVPKELLVGLLEQLDEAHPETITDTIVLLWKPLQDVLGRLGSRKASSLGMVLSTLLEQVAKLPVPKTKEQEKDDNFSLCRCCTVLRGFIIPLVHEARQNMLKSRKEMPDMSVDGKDSGLLVEELRAEELKTELLKFCMKSLYEPLLGVVLTDADTLTVSPIRDFAEEILFSLTQIGEPLHNLVFHPGLKRKAVPGFLEEEVLYPKESLASLAYLLFVNHFAALPAVFSPVFLLRCNMEHINLLLSRTEETWIQKGLELYQKSLMRTEDASLSVNLMNIKAFISVPQNLVKVMTLCPANHLRTKGLQVLQLSIDKFDTEAKYKFLQSMLRISNHSGVEGYIIKNIKNQIDYSLKPGNGNEWFQGTHLLPLLHQVLRLPDGPETDLLQYMDRVMESLNLLRYLVIRDKESENQTGIWTELCKIEENFLKPLRVGVNMSRAHYEMELRSTMDNKKTKDIGSSALSVTVGEEKLANMTKDSQIRALHSALDTFDMMESVLARIEELSLVT